MRAWTEEEIQFLKFAYPNKDFTTKDISRALNRTDSAIFIKAKRLGLKKYKEELPEGFKRCSKCSTIYSLENFPSFGSRGKHSWCKECFKRSYLKIEEFSDNKETSDVIENKECKRCGEIKKIELFNKHKASKDGYYRLCKLCQKKEKEKSDIKLIKERGW